MQDQFTLITGRTREQAEGLHKGVGSADYLKATAYVEISAEDLERLGLEQGQLVIVQSKFGRVTVPVKSGKMPPGLVFIPMGPTANTLVGTETYGTGMPSFKSQTVTLERP